ncbi:MAG: BrnA antitoxin family protein [Campylobacterales bacterium]|nr:BrnA antitoxin family protein [Campylobacterales bacterium]
MKTLPKFKDQSEEIAFWKTHDVTDFFDTKTAKIARFPNLKKSTKTISLRLPEDMLEALKVRANALDVPYQSLIKMLLKKELSL